MLRARVVGYSDPERMFVIGGTASGPAAKRRSAARDAILHRAALFNQHPWPAGVTHPALNPLGKCVSQDHGAVTLPAWRARPGTIIR